MLAAYSGHDEAFEYLLGRGDLYRLMSEAQRALLTSNIAGAMKSVPEFIQKKQVEHFKKADPEYGARVEQGLTRFVIPEGGKGVHAGDPRQVPVTK